MPIDRVFQQYQHQYDRHYKKSPPISTGEDIEVMLNDYWRSIVQTPLHHQLSIALGTLRERQIKLLNTSEI